MINNYVEYCYNWEIKINQNKFFFISFGYYNDIDAKLFINGNEIKKKN
jgi:hypothetical protein